MRLRMLKSVPGAEDGYTVRLYESGAVVEIGGTPRADELAQTFLGQGWAELADVEPAPEPSAPQVLRLPPLGEYVEAGYDPESYEGFIKNRTAEAEAHGGKAAVMPDPRKAASIDPAPSAPPTPAAPESGRKRKGK